MYIGAHHVELGIAIFCFIFGATTLVTTRVNTRQLRQAIPVLLGMLGWVFLALLALSAMYNLPLTGRINLIQGSWEYNLYSLCMAVVWFRHLKNVNRMHRVCRLRYTKND